MFTRERPYNFHIELTDKCNAGCPMCPRTDRFDRCRADRTKVRKIELTLADFETHFDADFCRRVGEIEFGGGLGDALAASQCLEICDHLTRHGVKMVISTNGGLRGRRWWEDLGRVLQRTGSCVELHVDGLRDTNPLYRVNTDFDKIMANARAYMATGARAEWHYILFRHNEHQAEEARALSRELGFSRFVLIDTIRFGGKSRFEYQMPDGSLRALEPAQLTSAEFNRRFNEPAPGDGAAGNGGDIATVNGIDCKSARHNRPYITTEGYVAPCCWMAGSGEERAMLELAGRDPEAFNIRNRRLAEILCDEPFVSLYERAWMESRNAICARKCRDMVRNTRMAV